MNKILNYIIVFLIIAIIAVVILVLKNNETVIEKNVVLDKHDISLTVNDTINLKANIEPNHNSTVIWVSSDEKIAVVDKNGQVTAKGIGQAIIKAIVDDKEDMCTITVKERKNDIEEIPSGSQINVKEVLLSTTSLNIANGLTQNFDIKVNNAVCVISVTSSDSSIIQVSPTNNDCNGEKCFFDAEQGKEYTLSYTVKAHSRGNAYINVLLTDCARYSDENEFTGSGKIGVLVS